MEIFDRIHKTITIPEICKQIIDTPEFQRLRRIKQLGCASFVYPCATHTRFEHSIGVAHLGRKLLTILKRNQPELKISEKDILLVFIAGLLHDVGHAPYSHAFEYLSEQNHEQC